jgi:two-component system response regulator AlgR
LLIVDDEPPARERLRQLCAGIPDIVVVGEAGNGREALELAGYLAPEVVLLDVRMPGMDGLEAARLICGDGSAGRLPAVIMVRAFGGDEIRAAASGIGIDHFLTIPVSR